MDELIKNIIESINDNSSGNKIPLFTKKGFESVTISKNNFSDISESQSDKSFCFIDGGNAELINSNNISLQLARVGACVYKNNERTEFTKEDYHILVTFKNKKFIAKTIPEKISLEFSIEDESLREGKSLGKISKIGGFIRRILELDLAYRMFDKSDYMVLDGSLEEKFTYENEYLKKLFSKNKPLIGFCKTNSMITLDGFSVSAHLMGLKDNAWIYHPIVKIDQSVFNADIFIAKLHEKSNYAFRVDIHNCDAKEFFENLMPNCKDAIFPGYPYGLVEVDRLARISNHEKEYEKTKLIIKLGKDWEKIKKMMTSQDAHGILDNV